MAHDKVAAVQPLELHRIVREEFGAGYLVDERVRNPRLLESPAGAKALAKEFEDMDIVVYGAS